MVLGNWLYAKVVMMCRRELNDMKEKYKTKIYNFQGKSARTKHWFYIDHEWLKDNFITREPDFYKNIYQTNFRGDKTKNYQKYGVPIGNAKMTKKVQFHTESPLIQYHQKSSSSSCLSGLASAFHSIGDNRSVTALVNCIE